MLPADGCQTCLPAPELACAWGQGRAAAATALLQELNDAVAGSFVDEAPDALLAANPRFLVDFSLVIATQARSAPCSLLESTGVRPCIARQPPGLLAGSLCCMVTTFSLTAGHQAVERIPCMIPCVP